MSKWKSKLRVDSTEWNRKRKKNIESCDAQSCYVGWKQIWSHKRSHYSFVLKKLLAQNISSVACSKLALLIDLFYIYWAKILIKFIISTSYMEVDYLPKVFRSFFFSSKWISVRFGCLNILCHIVLSSITYKIRKVNPVWELTMKVLK